MAPQKVLITGATGYIGGSVLSHLLSSNNLATKDLDISVVGRAGLRLETFTSTGLRTYSLKDHDDLEGLTAAASENDIIIHAASGSRATAEALIQGLGARKKANPEADVYFIHTTGTSDLADRPVSKTFVESRTFSDEDEDLYEYLKKREAAEPYGQRANALAVLEAGKKEGVPTTIISSPTIYGLGIGQFNRLTIQYPIQMRAALRNGRASYVGDGSGQWDYVHILDLVELYELVLLDHTRGAKSAPRGERGTLLFSGTGTFTWKEVAERIGGLGVEYGRFEEAAPASVSLGEAARMWTGGNEQLCELGFASNARTRAVVGGRMGWVPRRTREDWERSMREEFEEVMKEIV